MNKVSNSNPNINFQDGPNFCEGIPQHGTRTNMRLSIDGVKEPIYENEYQEKKKTPKREKHKE